MSSTDTDFVLAVDPGDAHVGWARWTKAGVVTGEIDAELAAGFVDVVLNVAVHHRIYRSVLVIENFVLYPGQDRRTTWNPMLTSELIGMLKWIASQRRVPVVLQGADIKKPTRAQLKPRGIKQVGSGSHARDAELHLYQYLLKEGLPCQ